MDQKSNHQISASLSFIVLLIFFVGFVAIAVTSFSDKSNVELASKAETAEPARLQSGDEIKYIQRLTGGWIVYVDRYGKMNDEKIVCTTIEEVLTLVAVTLSRGDKEENEWSDAVRRGFAEPESPEKDRTENE